MTGPTANSLVPFVCFLLVVFGVAFELGARYKFRQIDRNLRRRQAEKVARWRPSLVPVPPVDASDPATLVDAYGQAIYNAARMAYDGPAAPDEADQARQYQHLHADIRRLEADLKSRLTLGVGSGVPKDPGATDHLA